MYSIQSVLSIVLVSSFAIQSLQMLSQMLTSEVESLQCKIKETNFQCNNIQFFLWQHAAFSFIPLFLLQI